MKKKDNTPALIRVTRWLYPRLERWAPSVADRIFRLVFYVPVSYRVPDKEKEAAASADKFQIEVTGKKIQGYSWGDTSKPYVLLVHGWAGRATQFRKFIEPLNTAGFRVIGADGPAHGQSEGRRTSILEFESMLHALFRKFGEPTAVITHSFGGAAVLYSVMHGLPVKTLVNIASPTHEDEILKTYLRAINGSWPSAERFKKFVVKATGKTFHEFTAIYAVQHLKDPIHLMMVHDEEDRDVVIHQAEEFIKVYPSARLYRTSGLGHTRILKDEQVIREVVGFIEHHAVTVPSVH